MKPRKWMWMLIGHSSGYRDVISIVTQGSLILWFGMKNLLEAYADDANMLVLISTSQWDVWFQNHWTGIWLKLIHDVTHLEWNQILWKLKSMITSQIENLLACNSLIPDLNVNIWHLPPLVFFLFCLWYFKILVIFFMLSYLA